MKGKIKSLFSSDKKLYSSLNNLLGFYPNNIALYKLAFSHRSANTANLNGVKLNNERLEYLGDAILGAVIAEMLFKKFPFKEEGFLTELRSRIVNREHLNRLALKLGLDHYMREQVLVGNRSKSMYGDALEALLGAVYLDKGWRASRKLILERLVKLHMDLDELEVRDDNHKSKLINHCQREKIAIQFELLEEIENQGRKLLRIRLLLDGEERAVAEDYNRKKAEQTAALKVCEQLGIN